MNLIHHKFARYIVVFNYCMIILSGSVRAQSFNFSSPRFLNTDALTDENIDQSSNFAVGKNGVCITVWMSTDRGDNAFYEDPDVFYSRSLDYGETWSLPQILNETEDGNESAITPDIATDGEGKWIAVWLEGDAAGENRNESDIFYTVSADDGNTWSTPKVVNSYAFDDTGGESSPRVMYASNTWVTYWISIENYKGLVGTDFDLFFAVLDNDGESWSEARVLNSDAQTDSDSDREFSLNYNSQGSWIALWSKQISNKYDIYYSVSHDNLENWSTLKRLINTGSNNSSFVTRPSIESNPTGSWLASWSAREDSDSDYDIYYSISNDKGTSWSNPLILNTNASMEELDDLGVQTKYNSGIWVATWSTGKIRFFDGMTIEELDILYATSIDYGRTWSSPQNLNTNALTDEDNDGFPFLSFDSQGKLIAIWTSYDSLGGIIGSDRDLLFTTGQITFDEFGSSLIIR
jgi:hypothetical protein